MGVSIICQTLPFCYCTELPEILDSCICESSFVRQTLETAPFAELPLNCDVFIMLKLSCRSCCTITTTTTTTTTTTINLQQIEPVEFKL